MSSGHERVTEKGHLLLLRTSWYLPLLPVPMSRGGRPPGGWAPMWPLACALTLAACSSVSPLLQETTSDPPIATETQTGVWTQPELQTKAQTVAQTQTEPQTQPKLQTESPTELESQAATINHTGESEFSWTDV